MEAIYRPRYIVKFKTFMRKKEMEAQANEIITKLMMEGQCEVPANIDIDIVYDPMLTVRDRNDRVLDEIKSGRGLRPLFRIEDEE